MPLDKNFFLSINLSFTNNASPKKILQLSEISGGQYLEIV
jgi:hypothetical protein